MSRDQIEMFMTLDGLVLPDHPYRRFEDLVDFRVLSAPLKALYSDRGRPELGAERALRMLVLQPGLDATAPSLPPLVDAANPPAARRC